MRGPSQSLLVSASDGKDYVLKPHRPAVDEFCCIKELIANLLFCRLGINVPRPVTLTLDQTAKLSDKFLLDDSRLQLLASATHFGSAMPSIGSVYDFLPDQLLERCGNLSEIHAARVVDTWLGKQSERQTVYIQDPQWHRHYRVFFIDSKDIAFKTIARPSEGNFRQHAIPFDAEVIINAIERIRGIQPGIVAEIDAVIPDAWSRLWDQLRPKVLSWLNQVQVDSRILEKLDWSKNSSRPKVDEPSFAATKPTFDLVSGGGLFN
jgi:hypothetical protein